MHTLQGEAVTVLASAPSPTPRDTPTASRQARALAVLSRAVLAHPDLPVLRDIQVVAVARRPGRLAEVKLTAQVTVGDAAAVAAWAEAFGRPVEVHRPDGPDDARRYHCSTELELEPDALVAPSTLRVWTVVRPPTGDPVVDRLLGLDLADRTAS